MPLLAGIGAVASIYGGISSMTSANQEAQLQREQGGIALKEAEINAENEAYNQTVSTQKQRLAFLASGVSLEGSPTEVLASSKAYGQQQVDAILAQGSARFNLAQEEATITQNKGRAALIAGLAGAAGKAYQSGLFDSGSGSGDSPNSRNPNSTSMNGEA